MMGIVMPETCWASNKICNKKPQLHLVGILFPHIINGVFAQTFDTLTSIQVSGYVRQTQQYLLKYIKNETLNYKTSIRIAI